MWDHYQKTFLRMQFVMWLAAWASVIATHHLIVGLEFLAVMQVGSLLGAAWAARIRKPAQFPAGPRRSKSVQG
jgi:hypothetical protein